MCSATRMLACMCLWCVACERSNTLTPRASDQETGSAARISQETIVCHAAPEPSAVRSAQLGAAVKALDNFSAVLGLQYARFSYDTNRAVGSMHTNFLSTCNVSEFADFLQDLASVRARQNVIATEEYALVKLLAEQRLHAVLTDETHRRRLYDMAIPMMSLACVAGDFDYIVSLQELLLHPDVLADGDATVYRAAGWAAVQMLEYLSRAPDSVCSEALPRYGRTVQRCLDSTAAREQHHHVVPLYYSLCIAETWYAPQQARARMQAMRPDFLKAFPEFAVRIQAYYEGLMAGKHAGELDRFVARAEDRYIRQHTQ